MAISTGAYWPPPPSPPPPPHYYYYYHVLLSQHRSILTHLPVPTLHLGIDAVNALKERATVIGNNVRESVVGVGTIPFNRDNNKDHREKNIESIQASSNRNSGRHGNRWSELSEDLGANGKEISTNKSSHVINGNHTVYDEDIVTSPIH